MPGTSSEGAPVKTVSLLRPSIIAAMHASKRIWKGRFRAVILLLILGTAACGQTSPTATPIPTPTRQLTPYWSPTPSQTLPLKSLQINTPSPPPSPTLTPITYKVVKGDTMLGIALRFGVSLEDLLAANPEVDPRFLSIDTNLIIPLKEEEILVVIFSWSKTPSPMPWKISRPVSACILLTVKKSWERRV
jgi:LysM repeat protein